MKYLDKRWERHMVEDRERRKALFDQVDGRRIQELATPGSTPLWHTFSQGYGVPNIADYITALELRVARLEDE